MPCALQLMATPRNKRLVRSGARRFSLRIAVEAVEEGKLLPPFLYANHLDTEYFQKPIVILTQEESE